jgi:hypothetical protein
MRRGRLRPEAPQLAASQMAPRVRYSRVTSFGLLWGGPQG